MIFSIDFSPYDIIIGKNNILKRKNEKDVFFTKIINKKIKYIKGIILPEKNKKMPFMIIRCEETNNIKNSTKINKKNYKIIESYIPLNYYNEELEINIIKNKILELLNDNNTKKQDNKKIIIEKSIEKIKSDINNIYMEIDKDVKNKPTVEISNFKQERFGTEIEIIIKDNIRKINFNIKTYFNGNGSYIKNKTKINTMKGECYENQIMS